MGKTTNSNLTKKQRALIETFILATGQEWPSGLTTKEKKETLALMQGLVYLTKFRWMFLMDFPYVWKSGPYCSQLEAELTEIPTKAARDYASGKDFGSALTGTEKNVVRNAAEAVGDELPMHEAYAFASSLAHLANVIMPAESFEKIMERLAERRPVPNDAETSGKIWERLTKAGFISERR